MLGHKSDIADGSLRGWEFRKFGNLVGDYCVSPRFLDAVTVRPDQQPSFLSLLPSLVSKNETQSTVDMQYESLTRLKHFPRKLHYSASQPLGGLPF